MYLAYIIGLYKNNTWGKLLDMTWGEVFFNLVFK